MTWGEDSPWDRKLDLDVLASVVQVGACASAALHYRPG